MQATEADSAKLIGTRAEGRARGSGAAESEPGKRRWCEPRRWELGGNGKVPDRSADTSVCTPRRIGSWHGAMSPHFCSRYLMEFLTVIVGVI